MRGLRSGGGAETSKWAVHASPAHPRWPCPVARAREVCQESGLQYQERLGSVIQCLGKNGFLEFLAVLSSLEDGNAIRKGKYQKPLVYNK